MYLVRPAIYDHQILGFQYTRIQPHGKQFEAEGKTSAHVPLGPPTEGGSPRAKREIATGQATERRN